MPIPLVIFLIVLGFIILLFVLLFSVHAHVRIELANEMALTVRVLGIPIRILPKKEKTYNIKNYTLKKIRKREKKQAKKLAKKQEAAKKKALEKAKKKAEKKEAEAKLTKAEKKAIKREKRAKRPKLTEFIPLTASVAKLFFSRFFGKIHIKMARLHIKVGGKDAANIAMMYGILYPSLEMLLATLHKVCDLESLKKADIQMLPDFTSDKIVFDCDITFSVSLGNIVGAALKAGWAFLFGYTKIKPDPNEKKPSAKPPLPPLPPLPTPPPKP